MKKLKAKFVPAMVFCSAWLILVFQFGCQVAQTQVNSPSSIATTATPRPESDTANAAVNSARENDPKQNDDAPTDIDFEIKGVGIGTSEAEVVKKLGKPLQIKNDVVDEVCGGDFQKKLYYSGLMLVLLSDDEGRNYSVISVDVTSSKRMTDSVLKIGVDVKDVETAFGQPNNKKTDKGQIVFFYSLKRHEGGVKMFFQNDKLTRISWSLNFC